MAGADDIRRETEELERATKAIQAAQQVTARFTEGQRALAGVLKTATDALSAEVAVQQQYARFPLDAARQQWEAMAIPAKVRQGWQELREEKQRFGLDKAKVDWAAYTLPDRVKKDWQAFNAEKLRGKLDSEKANWEAFTLPDRVKQEWKDFRSEQAKFKRQQGPAGGLYKAAERYGGGAGRAIADAGIGGALKGSIWGLAIAAGAKVAQIGAENAERAIDHLLQTNQKLGDMAGKTGEFARAYGDNAIAAVKWGASVEVLNRATADFSTRLGMSVERAQGFTEFLARSSKMMGVDFADSAQYAHEQIETFGRSENDVRSFFQMVQTVSKESGAALGGMGQMGGKVGGIFAKDLFRAVQDVSKETDTFRGRSETLLMVMSNLAAGATKLGLSYGQVVDAIKSVIKSLGNLGDTESFMSGGGALKRLRGREGPMRKELTALERREKAGGLSEKQQERLNEVRRELNVIELARVSGIHAPQVALKHEMRKTGKEGWLARQEAAKGVAGQYGVDGKFYADRKAQGKTEEQIAAELKLTKKMAGTNWEDLTPKEQRDFNADQQRPVVKTETDQEKTVGRIMLALKPLAALEAAIMKAAGKIVDAVMSIAEFIQKRWGGGGGKPTYTPAEEAEGQEKVRRITTKNRADAITDEERSRRYRTRPSPVIDDAGGPLRDPADVPPDADDEINLGGKPAGKKAGKKAGSRPQRGAFLVAPDRTDLAAPPSFIPPDRLPRTAIESAGDNRSAAAPSGSGGGGGGGGAVAKGPDSMRGTGRVQVNQSGGATLNIQIEGWTEGVGAAYSQLKAGSSGTKTNV